MATKKSTKATPRWGDVKTKLADFDWHPWPVQDDGWSRNI